NRILRGFSLFHHWERKNLSFMERGTKLGITLPHPSAVGFSAGELLVKNRHLSNNPILSAPKSPPGGNVALRSTARVSISSWLLAHSSVIFVTEARWLADDNELQV